MGCGDDKIYKNWTYKYKLKVDEFNTVAETNENNNIAEHKFAGSKDVMNELNGAGIAKTTREKNTQVKNTTTSPTAPPPAPASDGSYEVHYTIRNAGVAPVEINVNGIRLFGRIREDGFERIGQLSNCSLSFQNPCTRRNHYRILHHRRCHDQYAHTGNAVRILVNGGFHKGYRGRQ
ncbi:hypothetical protein EV199_4542 [Pseudobacter ginsenosidimutans]|uniref:Uncharacterized protein n=2 Tax=Pseudobacter ginsenosidimutans TaxID=661488 RepID=A0A4Q7MZI3_9BACT|nr:hypothetical protein EV199_4542 [Pseudobacter ginsenosidimutans]